MWLLLRLGQPAGPGRSTGIAQRPRCRPRAPENLAQCHALVQPAVWVVEPELQLQSERVPRPGPGQRLQFQAEWRQSESSGAPGKGGPSRRGEQDFAQHRLGVDRKGVGAGKSESVRVDRGGRRIINTKNIL